MNKTVLTVLSVLSLTFALNAQQVKQRQIDLQNTREGENVEYCITHKKYNELLADPAWAQAIAETAQIQAQEALAGNPQPKATTYYIPIVFHLLHNNGPENISDDQILDAFNILNRDYDLLNPDAANVVNAFNASNGAATSIPTDVDIQFRLATIAPNA